MKVNPLAGNDRIYACSITVSIPNAAAIDETAIAVAVPVYDLNAPEPLAFAEEFKQAAAQSLEGYIPEEKSLSFTDIKLRVHLEKQDGVWIASFDNMDVSDMCDRLDAAIEEKAEQMLQACDDYKKVLLAESMGGRLPQLFPDDLYRHAVRVDAIDTLPDGYAVTIRYACCLTRRRCGKRKFGFGSAAAATRLFLL